MIATRKNTFFTKKLLIQSTLILSLCFCPNLLYAQNLQVQKMLYAYSYILYDYVDSLSQEKVCEDAIQGMLKNLDPHSTYLSKEEVKESEELLQGSFSGIGVSFTMIEDTLVVLETIPDGPCEKLGILPGDRIIMVNDTSIAGQKLTTTQIMKKLRGKRKTKVHVTILRDKYLLPFTIVRDNIPIKSVDTYYMIAPTVGYLKVNRFAAKTYEECVQALQDLRQQGMQNLILDLQDNGGGYMESAINIANELTDQQLPIVYTEGAHRDKEIYESSGYQPLFSQGKLVVVINEYSASASEILSGAIQDWDRGVIVGRRSFGKGLVQNQKRLPDGSVLRITMARYHTPSGRCIQKSYKNGKEEYEKELLKRFEHGEMISRDSIDRVDSLAYKTLTLGRTVYGGGGIMPDVFVPADTQKINSWVREIFKQGIPHQVSIPYAQAHKEQLKKLFNNAEDFNKQFKTNDLWELFLKNLTQKEISYTAKELECSKPLLTLHLKALVARQIWGQQAYYQLTNLDNENVAKALEIIQNDSIYYSILPNQDE